MELKQFGFSPYFQKEFEMKKTELREKQIFPGRVSAVYKDLFPLYTEMGELKGKLSGKMLRNKQFPATGDWVVWEYTPEKDYGIILELLPRATGLTRSINNAGRSSIKTSLYEQVLAANIDYVFIITSCNQEFSVRRLERYLTVAWDSGAIPVIVLNKSDLTDNPDEYVAKADSIAFGTPVLLTSALELQGLDVVREYLKEGKTAVFIGSSGVGKSTLVNALKDVAVQKTNGIRESDDKGRHTTTAREMILLGEGGAIIDAPGIRELHINITEEGIKTSFQDIEKLAESCRFKNCTHNHEPGCAVLEAVDQGELEHKRLKAYHALIREQKFLERKTKISQTVIKRDDRKKYLDKKYEVFRGKIANE